MAKDSIDMTKTCEAITFLPISDKHFDEVIHVHILVPASASETNEKDYVGLFPSGWTNTQQYITFEWVKDCTNSPSNLQLKTIIFRPEFHRKNVFNDVTYEFVYVSNQIEVVGVSKPFKFLVKPHKTPAESAVVEDLQLKNALKEREIEELKQQNKKLKESCKAAIEESSRNKTLMKEIVEEMIKGNRVQLVGGGRKLWISKCESQKCWFDIVSYLSNFLLKIVLFLTSLIMPSLNEQVHESRETSEDIISSADKTSFDNTAAQIVNQIQEYLKEEGVAELHDLSSDYSWESSLLEKQDGKLKEERGQGDGWK